MLKKNEWIDATLMRRLADEGTEAHRLCTTDEGWMERFERDILVSYKKDSERDRLIAEFDVWRKSVPFEFKRLFTRFLPKKNEERKRPRLVLGNQEAKPRTIAMEHFLKYAIDFEAGYSVGLFIDQRGNRRHVREIRPHHFLNCFSYTCSFSVAAASVRARTVNIDLSKKSLERGKENLALNGLSPADHQFIADDVLTVLPRLARRGEKFDTIILDPPTFSRSHRGRVFHVEKDFEELLASALELTTPGGRILLSSNSASLAEKDLEMMGRYCLKLTRRPGRFHRAPSLPDFPPGSGASTIWLTLR